MKPNMLVKELITVYLMKWLSFIESHKGFDESLKSKSHLSKQFNVCEKDFKVIFIINN